MAESAGIRNKQGAEVEETTRFMIASNSKLFTSLAVGIALDECGFPSGVDTRIKDVVPEYELMDAKAGETVTFADALSHCTGLPRHDHYTHNTTKTLEALLEVIRHMKPSCPPREISQYHNPHFDLIALIVERLTGTPFATYVKDKILDPAKLESTTVSADLFASSSERTGGFVHMFETSKHTGETLAIPLGLRDSSAACLGAGRMSSNIVDMSRWMQILLSEGRDPEGRQILPAILLKRCMKGTVQFHEYAREAPELSPAFYGMGLYEQSYHGFGMVEHVGALPGWMSRLCLVPSHRTGIFVAVNTSPWGEMVCDEIKFALLDDLIGVRPVDWHARFTKQREHSLELQDLAFSRFMSYTLPEAARLSKPTRLLLVGDYHCPGFSPFRIRDENVLEHVPDLVQLPWLPSAWGEMQPFFCVQKQHIGLCWRYTLREDDSEAVRFIFGLPATFELDISQNILRGIGLRQIWGAGRGVRSPCGDTVSERAEMYFEKVA